MTGLIFFVQSLAAVALAPTIFAQTEFAWGFGGSAYQIEGAWNTDGKGPNTFDVWSHSSPARIGQPNGDVSSDHYNRMESDLAYLGQLKATAYRFSISWPRILPNCTGQVNQKGIDFYNRMINEILKQGAEPFLTMYHWDLPQACMDQFGGFTNEKIIDAFTQYADVLYANFGDRVRYWLTINEPQAHCNFCIGRDIFPPALNLGDTGRFNCMHYSHLIHGSVVQLARTKYSSQSGNWKFGMPSIIEWYAPDGSDPELRADAGWFWGPCYDGDYPEFTKSYYKTLPSFTSAQKDMLKGTCNYLALNYYSGKNVPATQASGKSWQTVYPAGARLLATWMYKNMFKSDIIFTEIGYAAPDENKMTRQQITDDTQGLRSQFWRETVTNVTAALTIDNTPVKGMLAWALLDNLEFTQYDDRFGCIGVDYTNGTLDRYVKASTRDMANYFSQYSNPFKNGQAKPLNGASGSSSGDNSNVGGKSNTESGKSKNSAASLTSHVSSFYGGIAFAAALFAYML